MFCSIHTIGLHYKICKILSLAAAVVWNIFYIIVYISVWTISVAKKPWILEKLRIWQYRLKILKKTWILRFLKNLEHLTIFKCRVTKLGFYTKNLS